MAKAAANQKTIERLRKLADKSADADLKFRKELERAQLMAGWEEICAENGLNPEATPGDWKC